MQMIGGLLTIAVLCGGVEIEGGISGRTAAEDYALDDMLECWHVATKYQVVLAVNWMLEECSNDDNFDSCMTAALSPNMALDASGILCFAGCKSQNYFYPNSNHNNLETSYYMRDEYKAQFSRIMEEALPKCPDRESTTYHECLADEISELMKSHMTTIRDKIFDYCFVRDWSRALKAPEAIMTANPLDSRVYPTMDLTVDCWNRTMMIPMTACWKADTEKCFTEHTEAVEMAECLDLESYEDGQDGLIHLIHQVCTYDYSNLDALSQCLKDGFALPTDDLAKNIQACQDQHPNPSEGSSDVLPIMECVIQLYAGILEPLINQAVLTCFPQFSSAL